ncbi:hypothetical protein JOF53_002650 [Crossiella equi]|uniref:Tetratricopeptide repeat protein n=1 Tax=Crossiella equi TaxID=130796 RepID=A0ABS5AB23_9PSEU|nr:hypothetical protein [Crossiella equi]MBP2473778.1 hypothetical protein [Crossiella equi]
MAHHGFASMRLGLLGSSATQLDEAGALLDRAGASGVWTLFRYAGSPALVAGRAAEDEVRLATEALAARAALGFRTHARTFAGALAGAYAVLGEVEPAREQIALLRAQPGHGWRRLAELEALQAEAMLAARAARLTEASDLYVRLAELARELDLPQNRVRAWLGLAEVELARGRPAEADRWSRQALASAERIHHRMFQSWALLLLARSALELAVATEYEQGESQARQLLAELGQPSR